MSKECPYLVKNAVGGINLMIERDRGNRVLILTGKPTDSRKFWQKLERLIEDALFLIELEEKE